MLKQTFFLEVLNLRDNFPAINTWDVCGPGYLHGSPSPTCTGHWDAGAQWQRSDALRLGPARLDVVGQQGVRREQLSHLGGDDANMIIVGINRFHQCKGSAMQQFSFFTIVSLQFMFSVTPENTRDTSPGKHELREVVFSLLGGKSQCSWGIPVVLRVIWWAHPGVFLMEILSDPRLPNITWDILAILQKHLLVMCWMCFFDVPF